MVAGGWRHRWLFIADTTNWRVIKLKLFPEGKSKR